MQPMAASHAAAGNIAKYIDNPADAGKHITANVVYAASPNRFFQWLLTPVKVVARDALGGAEMFQPVKFFHLSSDSVYLVTRICQ